MRGGEQHNHSEQSHEARVSADRLRLEATRQQGMEATPPTPRGEVEPRRWPTAQELGRQACLGCARERLRDYWPGPMTERPIFTNPEDFLGVLTPLLAGRNREHGVLLALDTKYRLIEVEQVSVGTADHTFMAPREVYRDALLHGATAIAVAHNHPSGDPTPSNEDMRITFRLAQAGITLGVELIDHLVIGGEGQWRSLAREGLL